MKHRSGLLLSACAAALLLLTRASAATAQVTQAAGYTPPDDTPKVNVGVTIFADYTYQDVPTATDAGGNVIHKNSFNLTRTYINITGSFSHWFSFRVTPDIKAENGTGTSLTGNQTFRLKYGYGQVNFDDFAPKGSWFRFGLQQTPWIDYLEGVYRYRFQGTIFADAEGFLTSSDYGASARVAFPQNYGDIHVGFYNGDGYQSQNDVNGVNNEKAFQGRLSIRPAPAVPVAKGLRVTGFYDSDHYLPNAKRERAIGNLTFEHPFVNLGFEYLDAKDKATAAATELHRDGWSGWITLRTPFGIEALFRYDVLHQNKALAADPTKKRFVAGLAYWPPLQGGKSVAFLADYSEVKLENQATTAANVTTRIYAVHTLFNF
jgi:hypothetical protein